MAYKQSSLSAPEQSEAPTERLGKPCWRFFLTYTISPMKRIITLVSLFIGILLFATEPALSQRPGRMAPSDTMRGPEGLRGMMQPGMMQGGMMGQGMMQMMRGMHRQMMQNPMGRATMMAFMLPSLADTLGLSDDQLDQLQRLRNGMMDRQQRHRQQMMSQRQNLQRLFRDDESPSPDALREQMMVMAEAGVNQRVAMYETAQQMRQVLTAQQRERLQGMTPQQRMHQMMSQMPMMDMMRMMRSMHGMMGQGMRQQGQMMNPGIMQQQGMQMNMPRRQQRRNQ